MEKKVLTIEEIHQETERRKNIRRERLEKRLLNLLKIVIEKMLFMFFLRWLVG